MFEGGERGGGEIRSSSINHSHHRLYTYIGSTAARVSKVPSPGWHSFFFLCVQVVGTPSVAIRPFRVDMETRGDVGDGYR